MAEFLKDYYALVVGGLGFTGVLLGLWFNRKNALAIAADARSHERRTLAHALLAELRSVERAAERNVRDLRDRKNDGSDLLVPAAHHLAVFDSSVARLGLLAPSTIDDVVDAFLHVKEFDRNLTLLSKADSARQEYRLLPHDRIVPAAAMLEHLLKQTKQGVRALERSTK